MHTILVTGGCGYIGSHTIVDLLEKGFKVVCLDNLSNADERLLWGIQVITKQKVINHRVDMCDYAALVEVFAQNLDIKGVIHFAAYKAAGDSVHEPLSYYHNNICSQVNLLRCMEEFGVQNLIFSSSCTVYGNADELPVTEATPMKPAESPYGRTKQIGEDMINDASRANASLQAIMLRYFNPAGAHPSGHIGEAPQNITNLVPVIIEAVAGRRPALSIFGDDYDTRDGSCVRDYIHVCDLATAHTLAMQRLIASKNQKPVEVFNLGTGAGVTVIEAVNAFKKATGLDVPHTIAPRRAGDVVAIYADNSLAINELGWEPKYNVEDIMRTAWKWEQEEDRL
jgi:UDP-glucose 4-epimerase